VGGINAIYEQKIKRFLAYSSINQIGFLFVGLIGFNCSILSIQVFLFFLIVYCLNMFCLFILFFFIYSISLQNLAKSNFKNDNLHSLNCLFFRDLKVFFSLNLYFSIFNNNKNILIAKFSRLYCLLFICIFFSLAGIPPFIGFFSKFFIIFYCLKTKSWFTVSFLLIFSAISAFYYLKLIKVFFFEIPFSTFKHKMCLFFNYSFKSPLFTGFPISFVFNLVFICLSGILCFSFIYINII